jgi:hypothetical protein
MATVLLTPLKFRVSEMLGASQMSPQPSMGVSIMTLRMGARLGALAVPDQIAAEAS